MQLIDDKELNEKTWDELMIGKCKDQRTNDLVNGFLKMPKQAQGILINYLVNFDHTRLAPQSAWSLSALLLSGCDSPIEYVYSIALCLAYSFRYKELWYEGNDDIKTAGFEIFPQYQIEVDGKTYYADFLLSIDYMGSEIDGGQQWQGIVVECDGHEYHHATKEQVQHDNERELAIKKAGFDVIRFSGTQIYNDPFKCANDTLDYIIAEMNRRCVNDEEDG